jgi:hypothetical protein
MHEAWIFSPALERKEGKKKGRKGGREERREGGRENVIFVFVFYFFFIIILGTHVAFTKVLTIYHSLIHPLHLSPLSSLSPFLE